MAYYIGLSSGVVEFLKRYNARAPKGLEEHYKPARGSPRVLAPNGYNTGTSVRAPPSRALPSTTGSDQDDDGEAMEDHVSGS